MKNKMNFELNTVLIVDGFAPYHLSYILQTEEEIRTKISELSASTKVTEIIKYHVVYEHPCNLPPFEIKHDFKNKEGYKKNYKLPKEQIVTVKRKDYMKNFLEDDEYNNYCIQYQYMKQDEDFGFYYLQSVMYDLRNHDRKGTMDALYNQSKSNSIFYLTLYQYKKIDVDTFMKE